MPKKAKKTPKIAVLSDSDDEEDDFKVPKKKGHKFAISDSDDDDEFSPKLSTSKGKIDIYFQNLSLTIAISRIFQCLRKMRIVGIVPIP